MKKFFYEEIELMKNDFIGVDEVGRGCLAGPVVASAVYVKRGEVGIVKGVYDSKKISLKRREKLYEQIIKKHNYFTVYISSKTVDKINIHQASLMAMKKAYLGLKKNASILLVDGIYKLPSLKIVQESFKKGDQRFYSIAAASIIAKVERDKYMKKLSKKYPKYALEEHKGYGTKKHKEAISKFGILDIHRKSFNLS